jgi:hypothetical protein
MYIVSVSPGCTLRIIAWIYSDDLYNVLSENRLPASDGGCSCRIANPANRAR